MAKGVWVDDLQDIVVYGDDGVITNHATQVSSIEIYSFVMVVQ